jgi:hypothetical protein
MVALLKSVLGVFAYRFWSKSLPRHSRKPKKNSALKRPEGQHVPTVRQTWLARERFVMLGCVALGLLQLVVLKFPGLVWASFTGYLIRRLALQSLHLRSLPHSRGNPRVHQHNEQHQTPHA